MNIVNSAIAAESLDIFHETALTVAAEAEVVVVDMEVATGNATVAEMLATFLEIAQILIVAEKTMTKPTIVNKPKSSPDFTTEISS